MSDDNVVLEQYKMYVEMADRVSARRVATNKFYISLLAALLAFVTFVLSKQICYGYETAVLVSFSILGLVLNFVWLINIQSYRQLNSGKFRVIHEMEEKLAFPCYKKEWQILGEGKDSKQYRRLTRVERFVPYILSLPYLILLVYSVFR